MNPLSLQLPDALVEAIAQRVLERLPSHQSEPWVGVDDAAAHLNCKPQRIYDLMQRKDGTRIPHRKEGARLLFKLSVLDRWLESGEATL